MKRILPAGERCVVFLSRLSISGYKYAMILILTGLFFLGSSPVFAQKSPKKLTHFQIGDKISKNFVLGTSLEDSTKVITMKDYRGKAVILDFWATYCGTCIAKFPLVDSLNKVYYKNFQVVLMHISPQRENKNKVQNFINTYKKKYSTFKLPVVIIDTYAQKRFFVPSIPHYVWVDANGRIKAVTYSDELTDNNIKEFIAGRTLKLKQKTR